MYLTTFHYNDRNKNKKTLKAIMLNYTKKMKFVNRYVTVRNRTDGCT